MYTTILTTVAAGVLVASYPDGVVERRWQRWVARVMWWQLAVPLLLLVSGPNLVISPYLPEPPPSASVASPFTVSWLGAAARPLELLFWSYAPALFGAAVPVEVAFVAMAILGVSEDSYWFQLLGLLNIPLALSIPVSVVVGVLRHGLFDIEVVFRRSAVYAVPGSGSARCTWRWRPRRGSRSVARSRSSWRCS